MPTCLIHVQEAVVQMQAEMSEMSESFQKRQLADAAEMENIKVC
jgi:hypothetical protein